MMTGALKFLIAVMLASAGSAQEASQANPQANSDPLLNLKQRADNASGGSRAKLFAELARAEITLANQQFTSGEADSAQKQVASALEHATVAAVAAVNSG